MSATAYFNRFSSYCRMVSQAKELAKRSILVDHCVPTHINLTSEHDTIERVYAIEKNTRSGTSRLSLIEFKTKEDADSLVKTATHNEGSLPVPLKILRYYGSESKEPYRGDYPFPIESIRLRHDHPLIPFPLRLSKSSLHDYLNYDEMIAGNVMSLLDLKLRFITLVNFEKILCSGMFEEFELMPFGSSVIDIGCDSSDLDLIMTRKIDHHKAILDSVQAHSSGSKSNSASMRRKSIAHNLVHLDKQSNERSRYFDHKVMKWFDYVLKDHMPLTERIGVQPIYNAKVPIIKFTSRVTNIDCDLSFDLGNHQGNSTIDYPVPTVVLMTEILYSLCRNNNLITAFVIYLRLFGKESLITSKMPSVGMTNFQFLSIILFFLQQTSAARIPNRRSSQDGRYKNHRPDDTTKEMQIDGDTESRIVFAVRPPRVDSGRKSNFKTKCIVPAFGTMIMEGLARDKTVIEYEHYSESQLEQALPELVLHFFNYYGRFNFSEYALDLYDAKLKKKLNNCSLYVHNPLELERNICHNVNRKALDNLVKQFRLAEAELNRRGALNGDEMVDDELESPRKFRQPTTGDLFRIIADKFRVQDETIHRQGDQQFMRMGPIAHEVCT